MSLVSLLDMLVFAQRGISEPVSRMGDALRDPAVRDDPTQVLILIGVALVLGLLGWLLGRWTSPPSRRRICNNPWKLFSSLCEAHQLSRKEARLLYQLARSHGLEDPARLFLEPDRFDREALGAELRPYAEPLASLRDRLFGGLEDALPASPGEPTELPQGHSPDLSEGDSPRPTPQNGSGQASEVASSR